MAFEIRQATRAGLKLLIGLFGKSGTGKTLSALLLARGIAGPDGVIVLIDTESGRGLIFADIVPGGYKYIEIEPPFTPERFTEALIEAEKIASVIIIDSLTHEHSGEGGILDMQEGELSRMAGNDYEKRERVKLASWIKPKMEHKQFIGRLLRAKCAVICCLRGEDKTHMVKDEQNRTKVVTDKFSTPDFDKRFLFELLVNFETISIDGKGGYVYPVKITHPAIADLIPKENEQVTVEHGRRLAEWAAGGKTTGAQPATQQRVAPGRQLHARIWNRCKDHPPINGDPKNLEFYLVEEGKLLPKRALSSLTEPELLEIAEFIESKFPEPTK